jgi:hypothetical protein
METVNAPITLEAMRVKNRKKKATELRDNR